MTDVFGKNPAVGCQLEEVRSSASRGQERSLQELDLSFLTTVYHTIPFHTMTYHTKPYPSTPYYPLPYHTILYHPILTHTIPFHTLSYHSTLYHHHQALYYQQLQVKAVGLNSLAFQTLAKFQLEVIPGKFSACGYPWQSFSVCLSQELSPPPHTNDPTHRWQELQAATTPTTLLVIKISG